jgi:hypothetical protein
MKTAANRSLFSKALLLPVMLVFLVIFTAEALAQEPPPRPVEVTVAQPLAFGAFSHGLAGGSVIIDQTSNRTSTGDIILLNLGFLYAAATYRLVANQGTIINIMNGPDVSMTGSNGGSMLLHLGASNPVSPFVIGTTPPGYTELRVGATLTVGNAAANPPGSYSGTFDIIFIQE